MITDCDVCVIGSGAGGAPVALQLSRAGFSVIVLEKGPWYTEKDFFKDEIGACRRSMFTPSKRAEPHVVETHGSNGWRARPTSESNWDFWNGNMVGGATNLMSGFFLRMKPDDFRLRTVFGEISGASVTDWPITYDDLEPYYTLAEREVGISGRVIDHPFQEPRSTRDFPLPPTLEHPVAQWIDRAGAALGIHPFPLPRAVLSVPMGDRGACSYSGYCGSYGCATGAKGSARAALLGRAVKSGRCEIRANSMARKIISDPSGRAREVEYHTADGSVKKLSASIFVVACQPIESARLLLASAGPRHPNGLANRYEQVGKNLLFASGATVEGELPYEKFSESQVAELQSPRSFINRTVQDWYVIDDEDFGPRCKGGSMDFIFLHPNAISLARWYAFSSGTKMVWGDELKNGLRQYMRSGRHLMVEAFADWLPTADTQVSLDPGVKDRFGLPVARVRIKGHPHHQRIGGYLADRAKAVLAAIGAEDISGGADKGPSTNLPAGGCRFGLDPESSVLDPDCRAHGVDNLFVTDGSFIPTGGSVPYTWTIYANAFRVADKIAAQLGRQKGPEDREVAAPASIHLG